MKKTIMFGITIVGALGAQLYTETVKSTKVIMTGYIDSPSPCSIPVECSNALGPLCTIVFQGQARQAFGKINPSDVTCTKVLYRIP